MKDAALHRQRPDLGDLTARLRREARRITGPRQAVLRILEQHPHPLSNKEIFAALPQGECDLATVYRSVHLLEDMGLVKRYDFGDGTARFEIAEAGPDRHHHHLVCTACTEIVEIEDCLALDWEAQITRQSGFQSVTHKLEFFGVCPRCQQDSPSAKASSTPHGGAKKGHA